MAGGGAELPQMKAEPVHHAAVPRAADRTDSVIYNTAQEPGIQLHYTLVWCASAHTVRITFSHNQITKLKNARRIRAQYTLRPVFALKKL